MLHTSDWDWYSKEQSPVLDVETLQNPWLMHFDNEAAPVAIDFDASIWYVDSKLKENWILRNKWLFKKTYLIPGFYWKEIKKEYDYKN